MATFNDYRNIGFTTVSNMLLHYYSQLGLSEHELVLLLELESFSQMNNKFPSNSAIARRMNFSKIEIGKIIQELIDKNFLELKQKNDSNQKISNYYDLAPLNSKLDKLIDKNKINDQEIQSSSDIISKANNPIQNLVRQFEIEFGRLLSPIERQEVADWILIDHYSPEIIKLALRESILAQVYNFKYVDRILLNWSRHNLTTVDQVQNFLRRN